MSNDDEDFSVDLFDHLGDEEIGAVPKFKVTARGSEQNPNLADADIGKSLVVQSRLAHVCHGTLIEGGDPATLIIMLFIFQPKSNNSRFKRATITMIFSAGSDATDAPEVYNISPYGEFPLYLSERTEEVTHAFKPSLEGSAGPLKAAMGYEWSFKSTEQKQSRATISGLMRPNLGGSARYHRVVWDLSENGSTKSGIPSLFQAAILLKRKPSASDPLGEKFFSTLEITGKVNRRDEIQGALTDIEKKMSGRREKDEDIFFDPSLSDTSITQNPQRLFREDLNRFIRLVTIREWTDGGWKAEAKAELGPHSARTDTEATERPPEKRESLESQLPSFPQLSIPAPSTQDKLAEQNVSNFTAGIVSPSLSNPPPNPVFTPINTIITEESAVSQATESPQRTTKPDTSRLSDLMWTSEQRMEELRNEMVQVTRQKITTLHQELARVRIEANLVRRLLKLEEEEERIVREITRLESQNLGQT